MTRKREVEPMTFSDYQQWSAATDIMGASLTMPMMGLAGEVGSIIAEFKKHQRDSTGYVDFKDQLTEELGDLLWYAAAIARRADLSLDEVVQANLTKVHGRFNRPEAAPALSRLDAEAPVEQQFPDELRIVFRQSLRQADDATESPIRTVSMEVDGVQIGHSLDDNSVTDDEYRFHDAFHLANMTYLGWSPVMRSLLGRKRKYSNTADRTQDGARSIATEEGLAAMIFAGAEGHDRFRSATRVPWDLVKFCLKATAHLEVSSRSTADWEYAILNGFRVFNTLTQHGGGTVTADVRHRRLSFESP